MTDTIPEALRLRDQWVLWRDESGIKMPYATNGKKASTINPATWATYDEVRSIERQGHYSGIGFVFTPKDPLAGIDLDDCINEGKIAPWAQTIITETKSYAEVSPSGNGIKIFVEGVLPSSVKTRHIELYDRSRYFTVTGQRLEQAPPTVAPAQATLDKLYEKLHPAQAEPDPVPIAAPPTDDYLKEWAQKLIAQEVARVAMAGANEKHNTRFDAARLLGGLIPHGLVTAVELESILFAAQRPKTETQHKERKAIRDGLVNGSLSPLPLPEPPRQPVFDKQGWACCPEHETRLEPSKNGNGWHCMTYDCFWWKGDGYVPPEPLGTGPYGLTIGTKTAKADDPAPPVVDWLQRGVRASELQHRVFAQVNWPISNILSEGCTLLAGKPKSKKSWLALAMAVDVARGQPTLGGLETRQGRVLYLDLESNQRRMQSRLRALIGNDPWPANLHVFTEWPRGDAAIRQLDDWQAAFPDTLMVVADILQNVRALRVKNANPYDEDYEAVKPFTAWGERNHAGVLVIHHTRKAKADDVFDEISGSTGLLAGVAGMWVIGRMPNGPESVLAIRGRDIVIDDDMALAWDDYTCRFTLSGNAEERSISLERRSILDAMQESGEYTPKDLAEMLGKSVSTVNKLLTYLFSDRMVEKTGRGKYTKILGRQTYGLVIPNVPNVPNGKDVANGKDEGLSERFIDRSERHWDVPFRSESDSSASNGSSERSERSFKGPQTSGHDRDKRRLVYIAQALAKHDFKGARRATRDMLGNAERKAAEERIDEAERQYKANGGYGNVEGY